MNIGRPWRIRTPDSGLGNRRDPDFTNDLCSEIVGRLGPQLFPGWGDSTASINPPKERKISAGPDVLMSATLEDPRSCCILDRATRIELAPAPWEGAVRPSHRARVVRAPGIEPGSSGWKPDILPLNYARVRFRIVGGPGGLPGLQDLSVFSVPARLSCGAVTRAAASGPGAGLQPPMVAKVHSPARRPFPAGGYNKKPRVLSGAGLTFSGFGYFEPPPRPGPVSSARISTGLGHFSRLEPWEPANGRWNVPDAACGRLRDIHNRAKVLTESLLLVTGTPYPRKGSVSTGKF